MADKDTKNAPKVEAPVEAPSEAPHTTHKYSEKFAMIKIISIFALVFVFLVIFMVLEIKLHVLEKVFKLPPYLAYYSPLTLHLFRITFFILIGTIIAMIHRYGLNNMYDTLSTYMYIRNELQTKISYFDAAFLKKVFEPHEMESNTFISMENIVKLPDEMKRNVVMETAHKILEKKEKEAAEKAKAEKEAKEKETKEALEKIAKATGSQTTTPTTPPKK